MKNIKDIQRGSGNRTAGGASLLQEGNAESDHAHVRKTTALETKMREIMNDPQYQADAIDPGREKRTTAKRRAKDVRPL